MRRSTDDYSFNSSPVRLSIAERFLSTNYYNHHQSENSSVNTGLPSLRSLSSKLSHVSACSVIEKEHDFQQEKKCTQCNQARAKREISEDTQVYKESIKGIETVKQEHTIERRRCVCRGKPLCAIVSFVVIVLMVVSAFLLWPRTPLVRIDGAKSLYNPKVTETHHGILTHVTYENGWLIKLTMDNRQNYVPTRFNKIQIMATDALTGNVIGKGQQDLIDLPGKAISTIEVPLYINYGAQDPFDTTLMDLERACNGSHYALSLHFSLSFYIFILEKLNHVPTIVAVPATGGFYCP